MSVLLACLAVTGIILKWAPLWHRNERLFPMTLDPHTGTWYGPRELSYPQHQFFLGVMTTGIMIPLIPLAVIILMQYWIRSWVDFNAAFFALKKAMVLMYVNFVKCGFLALGYADSKIRLFIQIILKSYIGACARTVSSPKVVY
jgi:hypothetical protein